MLYAYVRLGLKNEPRFIGYNAIWKHRIRAEKEGLAVLIREDIEWEKQAVLRRAK